MNARLALLLYHTHTSLLTPQTPHTQDKERADSSSAPFPPACLDQAVPRPLIMPSRPPLPALRLPLSYALLPALLLLLLQLALITPTAYAFTKPAALPSRRRLVTPILKAASSSSPTVPPAFSSSRSHPSDNLQQQASLWGGNSHFGKRHILHFLAGY